MSYEDRLCSLLTRYVPEKSSANIVPLEISMCRADTIHTQDTMYRQNTYGPILTTLRRHSNEILDALIDATPQKPNSFRSGIIPLIREGGLFRGHACHVFEEYVAPVVAEEWYPYNPNQFVCNIISAVRNSPYSAAITAINTWGKAITRNPLWNISERIIHHYTEELHKTYMEKIERICNV